MRRCVAGVLLIFMVSSVSPSHSSDESKKISHPSWYPLDGEAKEVLQTFIESRLQPYQKKGIGKDFVKVALSLGACATCDPKEARWNSHFQIVNGAAYVVGGIPVFWNEHHRKRVKSVFALLDALTKLDPALPDVEFVVNFHDYNKHLRPPEASDAWGLTSYHPPFTNSSNTSNSSSFQVGGDAGTFREHVPQWEGQDWDLYYRIYGNHFGNGFDASSSDDSPKTSIFSATSCAFSHDISFPTTFYDFDLLDKEWDTLHNSTEHVHPWHDKRESAHFRGSCWFYKQHGRTAAFTMSEVAPDLVDAGWYDEIRTDMLEKDGVPQFGEIERAGAYKYLLHLEGHDFWSMRVRSLVQIRSLLLWQTLPCAEFYYGLFKPNQHYIPLQRDLGDLYEAVMWARDNDDQAKRIADAMVKRARATMSRGMVLQYTHMLLQRYAALLTYKVKLRKDAQKVDPKSKCLSTILPCVNGKPIGTR